MGFTVFSLNPEHVNRSNLLHGVVQFMGLWINLFYYWILTLVFQSVTNHLSLGGEVFWAGQHRKSGVGYAARYNTDKMVQWLETCSYMHNQQLTCFPLLIYLISDILHLFIYLEFVVVYSDVCKHIMPNIIVLLYQPISSFLFFQYSWSKTTMYIIDIKYHAGMVCFYLSNRKPLVMLQRVTYSAVMLRRGPWLLPYLPVATDCGNTGMIMHPYLFLHWPNLHVPPSKWEMVKKKQSVSHTLHCCNY